MRKDEQHRRVKCVTRRPISERKENSEEEKKHIKIRRECRKRERREIGKGRRRKKDKTAVKYDMN